MKKLIKQTILENLYFFIPFLIWVLCGAVMLLMFSRDELFFYVNLGFNPFLDKLNTVFSAYGRGDVIPLILVSLLLIPAFRNRNYIITSIVFGMMIPVAVFLMKFYFHTPRPLKYYGNGKVHTVPWLDNLFETSFPSGHTIGAFGFFLLLSLYSPKNIKPVSLLFFAMALACAYSRLYLGQHFFDDVYAGSIIGTILTFFIFVSGKHIIKPKTSNQNLIHEK